METTFITIHDLTNDARILYSSDSIVDILGHTPDEVVGKSCWEFFHPSEIPLAKQMHRRDVNLDKAAVLAYCQLKNRNGEWVGCECCFSVVYDVMVVCTSIYRSANDSSKRADEAYPVRRRFSSSPQDPRYHMLTHLSSKFKQDVATQTHEPRAALFLNRFTRTLTIMYATSGVQEIIGISGAEMKGRSFYYCIAEDCLEDAVRCLESAKGNDSIAYLRFWFRDPRFEDRTRENEENRMRDDEDEDMTEVDTDTSMTDVTSSEDEDDQGGVSVHSPSRSRSQGYVRPSISTADSGTSSSSNFTGTTSGQPNTPSVAPSPVPTASTSSSVDPHAGYIELEAVVSCTSDGLVVCLRRARPLLPQTAQEPPSQTTRATQQFPTPTPTMPPPTRGIFAAPWAIEPTYYPAPPAPPTSYFPGMPTSYAPPNFGAQFTSAGWNMQSLFPAPLQQAASKGGPEPVDFMKSIREVGVFAWGLTGINGALADYSRGKPKGESIPSGGLPFWDPTYREPAKPFVASPGRLPSVSPVGSGSSGLGTAGAGYSPSRGEYKPRDIFGDPGL
ncbi:hypothetical protein EJ06DRAFT_504561 [Trichodelitschia bisporula]|uniref:PAS domain-containing protein n=1 Tax=Trichodelitschia bisporula TaxID=703511 RepID=A0A6G1I624_9PEZI|nr:hypothetical protein EJ06DRAFT_504561 [Trichodelitschia bisporula]